MQARTHATTSTMPVTIANTLGVLAALVLLGVLTNLSLLVPFGDAAAFTALVIIGMSMCVIAGISRAPSTLGWMHPATLSGAVLGVAILLLVVANTFGFLQPDRCQRRHPASLVPPREKAPRHGRRRHRAHAARIRCPPPRRGADRNRRNRLVRPRRTPAPDGRT